MYISLQKLNRLLGLKPDESSRQTDYQNFWPGNLDKQKLFFEGEENSWLVETTAKKIKPKIIFSNSILAYCGPSEFDLHFLMRLSPITRYIYGVVEM